MTDMKVTVLPTIAQTNETDVDYDEIDYVSEKLRRLVSRPEKTKCHENIPDSHIEFMIIQKRKWNKYSSETKFTFISCCVCEFSRILSLQFHFD